VASYSSSKAVSVVAVAAGGGGGGASAAASAAAAAAASASACCCGWCPLLVLLLTSGAPACCCPFPSGRAPWDSEVARRLTARQRESSVPVVVAGGCCRVFESFFLVGVEFSLPPNRSLPLSLSDSLFSYLPRRPRRGACGEALERTTSVPRCGSEHERNGRGGGRDELRSRQRRRQRASPTMLCGFFSSVFSTSTLLLSLLTRCSITSFVSSQVYLNT
jgi:hypothetical protein